MCTIRVRLEVGTPEGGLVLTADGAHCDWKPGARGLPPDGCYDDARLPEGVTSGEEAFLVVGAVASGGS